MESILIIRSINKSNVGVFFIGLREYWTLCAIKYGEGLLWFWFWKIRFSSFNLTLNISLDKNQFKMVSKRFWHGCHNGMSFCFSMTHRVLASVWKLGNSRFWEAMFWKGRRKILKWIISYTKRGWRI